MRNPIWTKFNTSSNGLLATRQGNDRTWVNITMKCGVTADLIFNCKLCCAACVIEVKCISWHLLHLEKRICIYTVSHSMWNLPFISNNNFLKKKFPYITDQHFFKIRKYFVSLNICHFKLALSAWKRGTHGKFMANSSLAELNWNI